MAVEFSRGQSTLLGWPGSFTRFHAAYSHKLTFNLVEQPKNGDLLAGSEVESWQTNDDIPRFGFIFEHSLTHSQYVS